MVIFHSCRKAVLPFTDTAAEKSVHDKRKYFFFLSSSVFSPTLTYFGQYFLTVTHLLCKFFCDLYISVTLEPQLMHFFEPQVMSISTESGNSSKLDCFVRVQLTTAYDTP